MTTQAPPPPPTADFIAPVAKAAAIMAAGQLDLFRLLADGPRSIPDIARALGASESGMRLLAEALASVGYLERVDGRYANGPTARAWLTPQSPVDFTPLFFWAPLGWHLMEGLSGIIKRGAPDRPLYKYLEERPDLGRANSQYQKANAKLAVGPITQTVALPATARRLLDLGGSHGLYSVGFCKRYDSLQSVVFDLPVALTDTEAAIAGEGLTNRISLQRGDYLKDDIGQGYDVVLCFFLVHNHTEEENRRL